MNRSRGQVLVFFALALPLIVLPAAAYAVDASVTASAYSRLVEVTARAAEDAVQQIDLARLRAGGGISTDVASATRAAEDALAASEPSAHVKELSVLGAELRLVTTETLVLPFSFFGSPRVAVRADVTARLAPGYDSPVALRPPAYIVALGISGGVT